jgi:hypothetical protein
VMIANENCRPNSLIFFNAAAGSGGRHITENHWTSYPRVGPNGQTGFFAYGEPKNGYRVDLAIWNSSLSSGSQALLQQTTPNNYLGGDVSPVPLPSGTIGPLERLVTGCLCSAPRWSPDGNSTLCVAPHGDSGYFQLWWLDHAVDAKPAAPVMVTNGAIDLDATSAPVWNTSGLQLPMSLWIGVSRSS